MSLNYRALSRILGILFLLIGVCLVLPFITGLIYKEYDSSTAFAQTSIPCILIGALLVACVRPRSRTLKKRDGFLIVSGSWLIVSALGALPFVIQGCIPSFIDAFFETCSGFSTTGASILTNVEALPRSMMFWRMFTHWIGGMGILVLAVALLPALGIAGQTIVKSEAPGPSLSKVTPKMSDMAKVLYLIYFAGTLLETGLLMLGNMSFYDALIHSFATMGTGGFSGYNDSIAHFHSAYIDIVITVFMIIAGANFNLYYLGYKNGLKTFVRDTEFKLYIIIIGASSVMIAFCLFLTHTFDNFATALRYAAFQVASIITTTGFATTDFNLWPTFCIMVLLILFFIGGCSSSTAGGVKVIRVAVLLKMLKRAIQLKLHPNAMVAVKIDNKPIPTDTAQEICSFAFLYIALEFIVSIIISADGHDIMTNFSAAASCIGNIGPGFNDVGPTVNYSFFSPLSKMVLSLSMIAGRLELFTFFMLVHPKFWNSSH